MYLIVLCFFVLSGLVMARDPAWQADRGAS